MKLRFKINQAEAFRRGIDAPKSTTTVEVDPSTLTPEIRNLIADRLEGINVMRRTVTIDGDPLIVANEPTFEALIEAIKEDEGDHAGKAFAKAIIAKDQAK